MEYDPDTSSLRVSGRVCEENRDVKVCNLSGMT